MNTSQKKKTERLSKYNIDLLAEANFPRGTTNKMYYPDLGSDGYISMEFLPVFLRCHFAVKPPMGSRNIGCFLSLTYFEKGFI